MAWQRIRALVKKEMVRVFRDPSNLLLIILFPLLITLAFGISFGKLGTGGEQVYDIAVVNQDVNGAYPEWAVLFRGNLSENEMLEVFDYDALETAQKDLQNGKVSGIVVIPSGFGASIHSFWASPGNSSQWINCSVTIYADSGSIIMGSTLEPLVQQELIETIYGPDALNMPSPVDIGAPTGVESKKLSQFDYMAPALYAFAAIFLTMTIAEALSTERSSGLLKRIKLTPTTGTDFMAAQTISGMMSSIMQTVVVFVMAYIIGYRPAGGIAELLLAFGIVLAFSLCCIGFGLIAGSLAKNSGTATGLSFVFIMPQMFLGTFVMIGEPTIVNYLVPSFYVTDALTNLFLRGAPASSPVVLADLGIVLVFSCIVFIIGVLLFQRRGNK